MIMRRAEARQPVASLRAVARVQGGHIQQSTREASAGWLPSVPRRRKGAWGEGLGQGRGPRVSLTFHAALDFRDLEFVVRCSAVVQIANVTSQAEFKASLPALRFPARDARARDARGRVWVGGNCSLAAHRGKRPAPSRS